MWILPIIGYVGVIIGFCFLTLAIASGLYYLSELVEEHSVFTGKILTRLIYAVILLQFLLSMVDGFPWLLTLMSVASHVCYLGNLRHFPIVKLTDPVFIVSCALVLVNHFLWFRHFSSPISSVRHSRSTAYSRYDEYDDMPTFAQIASYFGICVWLAPFALFISLSANENVLPSMGSEYATGSHIRHPVSNGASDLTGSISSELSRAKSRNTGLVKATAWYLRDQLVRLGDGLGVGTARGRF